MPRSNAAHLFLAIVACYLLPLGVAAQAGIGGDWKGSLEVDGTTLRLILHIKSAANGALTATLDSVDQDSPGIPVNSIAFQDPTLRLDVAQVNGSFEGKLSKDGNEIKGYWNEGKRRALTFQRITDPTRIVPVVPIGGDWEGILVEGGKRFHLILHIDTWHYTRLSASLDGMDGVTSGARIDRIAFVDNALKFSVNAIHASYSGTLTADGNAIEGEWKQGGSSPLILRRSPAAVQPANAPAHR